MRSIQAELRPANACCYDLSDLAGSVNRISFCGATVEPGRFGRFFLRRSILLERGFYRCHEGAPVSLEGVQIAAEGSLKGAGNPVAAGRRRAIPALAGIRAAQQVEERQKLSRMPGAQVVNQGPGLRVKVALIATAESGVSDQALQRNRVLNSPPIRQAAGRGHG